MDLLVLNVRATTSLNPESYPHTTSDFIDEAVDMASYMTTKKIVNSGQSSVAVSAVAGRDEGTRIY